MNDKLYSIIIFSITLLVILIVGYMVFWIQKNDILVYCQNLINQSIIQNMSQCNVTMLAGKYYY